MEFKVKGNYLGNEIFTSKKSGEMYKVIKVIINEDKYQCFSDINLDVSNFTRFEEVIIKFRLTPYQNNYNLNILGIEKIK